MANKEYQDLTQASALDGSEIVALKQGSNSRKDTVKSLAKFSAKAVVSVLITDPNASSAITTGDGKAYYRVPAALNGFNLTAVAASVDTASSSGTPTFQLRRKRSGSDVDMLSTAITINASETDSSTAATAAVINTSNDDVATGDRIYFDFDVAGTGTKGVSIEMTFELP
jgi:hypothetical protein